MVKGWIRTTLIDFPGHIATTLFLGRCNMRCPMCHNPDLVLQPTALPDIPIESIIEYLKNRQGKITGIVLSGGEPCLSAEIMSLLSRFNQLDLAVKLDTNGYTPAVLNDILTRHWVDYVAMDIKAPLEKYPLLCGLPKMELSRIQSSVDLIAKSGIDHEFRTTVVPQWITAGDIATIAKWLPQASRYILQQFRSQGCLDPEYNHLSAYPAETLLHMQALAKTHLQDVTVRGI